MSSGFWRLPAYIDNKVLAAATAETITKPAGKNSAVITAEMDCWIRNGGTAAVPTVDVDDGTGSSFCPAGVPRIVDFATSHSASLASISIISAAAGAVSIEWFA